MNTFKLHRILKQIISLLFIISIHVIHFQALAQNSTTYLITLWNANKLIKSSDSLIAYTGNPCMNLSRGIYSIAFNGINDGVFIDSLPLRNLSRYTVEVVFYPEKDGLFEQRFFHCGSIRGNRIMLETRSTQTDWYFDAFIKCNEKGLALADSELLHPLDQWYHVAFVIDNGKLFSYVNRKIELQDEIDFYPISDGITSIGVRQNKVSWFKGKIHSITITPKALTPKEFTIPNLINQN